MIQKLKDNLRSLVFLVLVALLMWGLFGPIQLGGDVSYVIINGESMEPDIHEGDLVLARRRADYSIGQRVVYTHPRLGYVFHRIIDQESVNYILKGDNNHWLDAYHPEFAEILGSYWFVIPKVGRLVRWLRQPSVFLVFTLLLVIIFGMMLRVGDRKRRKKKQKGKRFMTKNPNSPSYRDSYQDLILLAVVVLVAGIALALYSYTKPLLREVADDIFISHSSTFEYTGDDSSGIYDRSGIVTGNPIYPALTCILNMDYKYRFSSMSSTPENLENIQGKIEIHAVLSDPDGWKRTFLLVPENKFQGPGVRSALSMNICRLLELIDEKEELTSSEVRWYSLEVVPRITIAGEVDGTTFEEEFLPIIFFELNESVLKIADDENILLGKETMLPRTNLVENSLTVFGANLPIRVARQLAWILIGGALLIGFYPIYQIFRLWKESEASRIKMQSEPLMVDVAPNTIRKRGQIIVEVATIRDLQKIASRYSAVILHQAKGEEHIYSIQDEGLLYQYTSIEPMENDKEPPLDKE